jgi:hypothetical protein
MLGTAGFVRFFPGFFPVAPLSPTFGAASGWYRAGQSAPGSLADRAAMRLAALPATVVVLYRRGARIPVGELLRAEPPSGWLVASDRYTGPHWTASLFAADDMQREVLPRLLRAQLEREHGGVRLYGGLDVDAARERQEWRQAWLCTPTPARAREILLSMAAQQGEDV